MPDNPNSVIRRVNYRDKRETTTVLCEADTFASYHSPEGWLILELTRTDAQGRPLEGFRFEFCPEDAGRTRQETNDWARRHKVVT